jgi:hypothetical protein
VCLDIPVSWPYFPFLPLINNKSQQVGCLTAINLIDFTLEHNLYTIFLINLIDIDGMHINDILKLDKVCFKSKEELLEAGWDYV